MFVRVSASLSIAAVLVCAPVLGQSAQAQRPLVQESAPGASSYIVPVIAGVIVGALVWPMIVPAAVDAAAMGGAGRMAMPAAGAAETAAAAGTAATNAAAAGTAAVAAAPSAAATEAAALTTATEAGWSWRTLSSSPAVIGGAIGGALAFVLSR